MLTRTFDHGQKLLELLGRKARCLSLTTRTALRLGAARSYCCVGVTSVGRFSALWLIVVWIAISSLVPFRIPINFETTVHVVFRFVAVSAEKSSIIPGSRSAVSGRRRTLQRAVWTANAVAPSIRSSWSRMTIRWDSFGVMSEYALLCVDNGFILKICEYMVSKMESSKSRRK